MRSSFIFSLLSLFSFIIGHTQTEAQLRETIHISQNDSIKGDALAKLCFELAVDKADEAIQFGLQAQNIAEKLANQPILQRTYDALAQCYDTKQDYLKSFQFFQLAIKANGLIHDSLFLSGIYNNMGNSYYYQGKLDSSLVYHFKSLNLRTKLNAQKDMSRSLNNLGLVYRVKQDYTSALNYYNQSLKIKTALGDRKGINNTLLNIGGLYKTTKNYDSAIIIYQRLYDTATKNKSTIGAITAKTALALCLNSQQKYAISLPLFQDLYKNPLSKDIGDTYPFLLMGLGEAFVGNQSYHEAIPFLKQALTVNFPVDRFENKAAIHQILAEAYEQLSDFKNALLHVHAFKQYSDSLLNETNIRSINELSTKYKTIENENKIELLNKENQVQQLLLFENKRDRIILFLIIILITVLSFGLLYLYRNKQKSSLLLEEKNVLIGKSLNEKEVLLKEIHHRVKNNLQVVSSLLNLQSRSITDTQAQSAIREGRDRVKSMSIIHQNLYQDDNLTGVDMKQYIEELTNSLFHSYNIQKERISLETTIDSMQLDIDHVIPIGLILNELISNALKYAFPENEGTIFISLHKTNETLVLKVSDNGIGLPPDFNMDKLTSLGFQLIRSFVNKMKATISIEGEKGTSVCLVIPRSKMGLSKF